MLQQHPCNNLMPPHDIFPDQLYPKSITEMSYQIELTRLARKNVRSTNQLPTQSEKIWPIRPIANPIAGLARLAIVCQLEVSQLANVRIWSSGQLIVNPIQVGLAAN